MFADEMMELAKKIEEENEIFIGNQNEKNYNEDKYNLEVEFDLNTKKRFIKKDRTN